jgi:PEP-CTERM motif
MWFRIIARSMLCLCLLTVPALPAFAGPRGGNDQGDNNDDQGDRGPRHSVPEPSASLLLGLGLLGIAGYRRFQKQLRRCREQAKAE